MKIGCPFSADALWLYNVWEFFFYLFLFLFLFFCSGMFFIESKVMETLKLGQFLEILSKVSDPVIRCNKNSSILKSH